MSLSDFPIVGRAALACRGGLPIAGLKVGSQTLRLYPGPTVHHGIVTRRQNLPLRSSRQFGDMLLGPAIERVRRFDKNGEPFPLFRSGGAVQTAYVAKNGDNSPAPPWRAVTRHGLCRQGVPISACPCVWISIRMTLLHGVARSLAARHGEPGAAKDNLSAAGRAPPWRNITMGEATTWRTNRDHRMTEASNSIARRGGLRVQSGYAQPATPLPRWRRLIPRLSRPHHTVTSNYFEF